MPTPVANMSVEEIIAAVDSVANVENSGPFVTDDVVFLSRESYERMVSVRVAQAFAASDLPFAQ